MSHKVTIKTQVKDRGVFVAACQAMNVECRFGQQTIELFGTQTASGDISVKLKGWLYPVVIDTRTGTVSFDNYGGHWGQQVELDRLIQEYNLQLAEREAESFVLQGWQIERQTLSNGDVQVIIQEAQ